MSIKGRCLGRVNDDLGGAIAVRYVDCATTVLAANTRVASMQVAACFVLGLALVPPSVAAVAAEDDGKGEGEGCDELGCLGG